MSTKLDQLIQTFNNFEHKNGLCLKFPDGFKIPDSPREFLYLFLTDYNDKYLTYNKENLNYPVTSTGRRRSVNETFDIILFYYPDYTVIKYFQDIYSVVYQIFESGGSVCCHFCSTIQRNVFLINSYSYQGFLRDNNLDISNKENFPYLFVWKKNVNKPNAYFWNNFNDPEICLELTGGKYILKEK